MSAPCVYMSVPSYRSPLNPRTGKETVGTKNVEREAVQDLNVLPMRVAMLYMEGRVAP